MPALDVAIVVGHDSTSQGARAVDGVREWTWTRPLATQVAVELERRGRRAGVLLRDTHGGYQAKMKRVAGAITAAGAQVAVELHFNANGGSGTGRTEVLYWPGSSRGQKLAALMADQVAECLGPKRRRQAVAQARSWAHAEDLDGDGRVDPAGPPLYFLQLTRCPAVIVESHFGDIDSDHTIATEARDDGRLAVAIATAIDSFLRG